MLWCKCYTQLTPNRSLWIQKEEWKGYSLSVENVEIRQDGYKYWSFYSYIIDSKTPKPKPEHTYSRQYFSNQLVATYGDKHKTVAELHENGTITWKTTPKYLLKDTEKLFPTLQVLSVLKIPRSETILYWKVLAAPIEEPHKILPVLLQER